MHRRTPSLKHVAAGALLALAFLFAQQTAALHWLAHAIEATQAKTDKGAPAGHHCDECVTLGALGAAAGTTESTLALAAGQHALLAPPPAAAARAAARLAFRSRAPPALV